MARLFTCGAEGRDRGNATSIDGVTTGGTAATYETTVVRSGSASFKFDSGAGSSTTAIIRALGTLTLARSYFERHFFRVSALPTALATLMSVATGGVPFAAVKLTTGGNLALYAGNPASPTQVGSNSAAAVAIGEWHRIELKFAIGTGAADVLELRLDGVLVASSSTLNLTDTLTLGEIDWGWLDTTGGAGGGNKLQYVDDIAVNDDQGADQNGYPGEGKVVLLLPTADSARDTLWTAGAGGTTNLWDAVNNVPPVGVAAASETNTSQIKHAGTAAGTTDRYDATMETYAAKGLTPGSWVTVLHAIVVVGEEVTTGTKNLSVEVLSNPVVATTGAFDVNPASVAVGTYPTGWVVKNGTIKYGPFAVATGTSPVLRVVRPETAARVADACFMGILAEYTPGLAPPPFQRRLRTTTQRKVA